MDISSATARVAPDLLKALAILSDTTVRRSAVDQEEPKPYWKSEKGHISLGVQQTIIYKVIKDFANHRKKTNKAVGFSCRPFPIIFKYRDHQWQFPTIWKTRFFQTHIKEFS